MRNENLEEMTWDILMSLRKSNAPANYKVVKNAQTELLALFTQQLKSVSECNCPELGGSSEGAAPHPSLNPQVDNHLNNELEEAIGQVLARVYYRGLDKKGWSQTEEIMDTGDILNIINQEKAKLVDRIEKELTGLEIDLEATKKHMESKGANESDILIMELEADDRKDILNDVRTQLIRIKQEEGLK